MVHAVENARSVVPGSIVTLQVEGTQVAIANIGGDFFAFDNTCTHRGCALATGTLDGAVVTCPCHGSKFDVTTGAVVAGPASVPVATYVVEVVHDELRVSLSAEVLPHAGQEGTAERPRADVDTVERMTTASVLAAVPLFSGLDGVSIESLVPFTFRRTFQPGDVIVEEGSTGNGLYVVISGQVEVVKGLGGTRPHRAAVLGPAEPFGEMALLGDWKRSASIRALEESECLGMDRWVFLTHLQHEPQLAIRLLQVLAQRLAETNEKLAE